MRVFVIPGCWLALAALGSVAAWSEAIHLKNGDVIYADQVREAGQNLEYEIGDNSYTIPKSKVESVEAVPRPDASQAAGSALPVLRPQPPAVDEPELLSNIVHNGQVDR